MVTDFVKFYSKQKKLLTIHFFVDSHDNLDNSRLPNSYINEFYTEQTD